MHYRPRGEPLAPHALSARPGELRRGKGLETLRTQLVHRGVHDRALRVEDRPSAPSGPPSRPGGAGSSCRAWPGRGQSFGPSRGGPRAGSAAPVTTPAQPAPSRAARLLRQARDGTADAL